MKRISSIISILLILLLVSSCDFFVNWDRAEEVSTTASSTTVRINLSSDSVETNNADSVVVQSALINGMELPVSIKTDECEILEDADGYYINYDLGSFGKHQVTLKYTADGTITDFENFEYILTADEYNIALLTATVPVTYFSLFMADEDNAYAEELGLGINSQIPTIMALERSAAYNWDECLPNIIKNPFADSGKYGSNLDTIALFELTEAFHQYVGYLHGLNSDSVFHLFINDFESFLIPYLMLENGIGFDQFDVYAISDGTGTPAIFREKYGTGVSPDNSMAFYSEVEEAWNSVKVKALNGQGYSDEFVKFTGLFPALNRQMIDFMPVLINDPELKIEWIMNRNNPDAFGTSQAYTEKVQGNDRAPQINMNSILGALSPDEITAFQKMYKFDSSVFEEADENGKGIMIFLGTSTAGEVYFEDYLTFMTTYYGDDYVFYYKAHPGYAADFDSNKAALLDRLGIISLDASIPAELFYFFRNDVVMCGYQSSTFENAAGVAISCIVNTNTETYNGRADLTILANEDGTFTVTNIKDHPGTFIWDPAKPDVFPWLE